MRIESKLRIAGVLTEQLLSLDAWIKRKQMFGWNPCDSEPQAQDIGSLNMNLRVYKFDDPVSALVFLS